MYSKILKAEFITPCFCGGADQSKPELRTQSIRGQLRWWYRICGATRDEEAELFGSTEKISPLTVRIAKVNLGHEPFNLNDQNNELSTYLWYFLKNQGGHNHQGRKCLPVKTSFDLVLKSREKDLLEKGVAVAALWISLGALGSRSTRAAGCMRLVTADCPQTKKLADAINEANEPVSLWDTIKSYLPCKKEKKPFELYRRPKETSSGLDAAKWLAEKWWEVRRYKFKPPP
ncbi:MAG: type III-B CRISPR module RAMP protein Cmr1 [Thermodesulfobacteriota bacterium]|nr:type III-B CRISPR module RAMP protein Cmr1 [Thermodesulfobacteriota bacterium]